jgi:pimeloyl-ACP methyl ester carboxylesterase
MMAPVMALALAACALPPTPMKSVEPPALAPAHASGAQERYAVSADGVRIHYTVSGEGPLVVMIHGFPDYAGTWSKLVPALDDAYRTVAIDTRGYNFSDKPTDVDSYRRDRLVADVEAVIRAEGRTSATLIGHDFGAFISWYFAFDRPQMTTSLVILSVPHPANFANELATNPEQMRNSQYALALQQEGSERFLTAEQFAAGRTDPVERRNYLEALKRSDFRAMTNYYRANFPIGANAPKHGEAPAEFPTVTAPVLVIHGVKDPYLLSSGHSRSWERISSDSTFLMIPEANHNVHLDAPDLVNRTIRDWLDARRED